MTYRLEAQMTPVVRRSLERQGLQVKCEFAVPWGICDLVGVEFDPKQVRKRLALGQTGTIGPTVRVELLYRIPDRATGSYAKIASLQREFTGLLDEARFREELTRLHKAGFVTFPKPGAVHKLNGWMPLQRRIVSVELKLARPLEALDQAAAHLRFADFSYVALPAPLAGRVAHSDKRGAFLRAGVGLLAVGRRRCRTMLSPTSSPPATDPVLQTHCVERFWRTRKTAYKTT